MESYNHQKIEKKWQEKWKKQKLYKTKDSKKSADNFYTLVEFPYPSGNLHVGHWYAFAVPDIFARYKRMRGANVMFPFGFDAFGLPAENAAIKRDLNPKDWTYENIEYMEKQIESMGASFDWDRKVVTAEPEYYKWTQWMFTEFFKNDLAYQKKTLTNWCPSCKTVLANEQVTAGKCERCDSEVEKKEILQWNLRTTNYAERLLNDLDKLDWPEPIKDSQRNWIGRSEGAEIDFKIKNSELKITVFTTRPDTIFGATYLVLAPEHEWVSELISKVENKEEVIRYIELSKKKTEIERTAEGKEKTGVELKGIKAINPATKEEVPIWIADYVLSGYGTGAIMAVPSDDKRDKEFAEKFNLPIMDEYKSAEFEEFGKKVVKYKLRDWGVSRQRYWGVPIPIIHCEKCGQVAVPKKDLPVELPEIEDYLPRDDGKSPLAKAENWMNVKCPKCKGKAERETDTLDTFVDSSWYFLRYTDPKNKKEFASKAKMEKWMPVDFYSGGAEHTTMHLLYSRFWQKVLFDFGFVKDEEPYKVRMNRGLILGPDGNKMSKSKGNVIDPDEVVQNLGADTVRAYLAFIGPFNEVGSYPWSIDGIVGIRRFLEKVWKLQEKISEKKEIENETLLNQTIQKVGEDIESLKMNTAVSALMIFVNSLTKQAEISKKEFETLLMLLAPIAPHTSEELWQIIGNKNSIHTSNWPKFDGTKIKEKVKIVVQINGKVREILNIDTKLSEKEVLNRSLEIPGVKKWLEGKNIVKHIYIKDRVLNIISD